MNKHVIWFNVYYSLPGYINIKALLARGSATAEEDPREGETGAGAELLHFPECSASPEAVGLVEFCNKNLK